MDDAWLLGLAPSGVVCCGRACNGLEGGLAMAGSVLRMLAGSPSFAAPNQDGASPDASFCDAKRKGVVPRLFVRRCCAPCCDPCERGLAPVSMFFGSAGTGGVS